ncbi:MAG: co-chaperone DjlA [Kistimonas sp.]|nr:co-chaperone DjlA [Kistimonas sp.]
MLLRILLYSLVGMLFGGPIAAVTGALVGIWLDKNIHGLRNRRWQSQAYQQRIQTAFFEAAFLVMGRLAKADGRVNEEEIQMATSLMHEMQLGPGQRKQAIVLFNKGKEGASIMEALMNFRQHADAALVQMFLEVQVQACWADGEATAAEMSVLYEICRHLGVSRMDFQRLQQRVRAQRAFHSQDREYSGFQGNRQHRRPGAGQLDEAYATLGVARGASPQEIKKAWRRRMSEHHPDKLVSKGLPEEMMQMAKRKTQEIQAAYDLIRQQGKG